MVFAEFGEDLLHDGVTEEGGAVLDTEAAAVFLDGGNFLVVEVDGLAVAAEEGEALLFEEVGIDTRHFGFLCHGVRALDLV